MHLLLVEDDPMLAEAILDGARQIAWAMDHVGDATAARLALVDHAYSAVLLDIGLPGDSGLTVLKALRGRYDPTPVLMLTARGQLSERIQGLDAGADDYLVKPFQFDELWARVRAVVRRSEGRVVPVFQHGSVRLDRSKRVVTRDGVGVPLSAHEYRTLLALLERPGHVLTRDHLQDVVYGTASTVESNTIAVFIHQLRRKLGDGFITTVHGRGYMVGEPDA
ncbi:response regulator transcription factor [Pseudorhodoferax sp. Leaf265]|jgi:two-component system OmpR family response regulator|uniref:response regulator transcription factor n=1 Tax=Pseudorhodoferax sp. Leaf265 TaxID=1736315 RepID=UPI0006F54E54|nr:response regulator transcription factor [Pseudorhodoferax sp. Leaf265]KQP14536.1 two-component system response regulator [Pseudorhodoferax sp. Leaf265]PZP91835.1 MAG: DNA-binding response regulator [Variovorax paradoxus]PZQ01830.1 MAG: DNA-binding response regulator [Variovorax paradoxus]